MSYCPLFWGFMEIYKAHDTQYILRKMTKKLVVFCVYGYFSELSPTILGFRGDLQAHDTQYMLERHDQNSSFLRYRAIFMSYCPLFWGYMEI
jgi:hypothetical protein